MRLPSLLVCTSGLLSVTAAHSLGSTIASHHSLSLLHDVLQYHDLLDDLNAAQNATYFAPSNAALEYLADFGINLTTADPSIAKALIFYSLVDGVHSSESIVSNDQVQLVHSALFPPLFTNVSDGQALKLTKDPTGSQPKMVLETGLQILTQVEETDIAFDHGLIHTTSTNMVLPHNVSETCRLGQLTGFSHLMRTSGAELEVNSLADMTLFLPHDSALNELQPLLDTLGPEQLAAVVRNHAVIGEVLYQDQIGQKVHESETLSGHTLQIRRGSHGQMYVNNLEVVREDLLLYGGVAHIIDGVLLPVLDDSGSCKSTIGAVLAANGRELTALASRWLHSKRNGLIIGALAFLAIMSILAKLCWQRRRKHHHFLMLRGGSSEALLEGHNSYGWEEK